MLHAKLRTELVKDWTDKDKDKDKD